MSAPADVERRLIIVPNLDHMLWHIRKEEFATEYLFGRIPKAKGAIAGHPGAQVWAIWTHRYYGHPDFESSQNVLYILRLVIEGDDSRSRPLQAKPSKNLGGIASIKAVMEAAEAEAAEWQLDCVKLWDPSPLVQELLIETGMEYHIIEREEDSIASPLWYDENGREKTAPVWINNEHYSWL